MENVYQERTYNQYVTSQEGRNWAGISILGITDVIGIFHSGYQVDMN